MSDIEIIRVYRDTNDTSFLGELYKRYTKMMLVMCYKYLKSKEVAKEAVAQVFEVLIEALKKYDIDNFKSWLMTVCRNHCFLMLKNNKGIVEYCDFFEKNAPDVVEFEDIFTQYDKEDREKVFDKLYDGIADLPEEQKRCIELFYLQGKSYGEIIEVTGYSFKQIKSYLQNGRRNLRNYLGKAVALLMFFFYFI